MNYLFKNEVVNYEFSNANSSETILFLHGWGGNRFSFTQTINLTKTKFNILSITLPTTADTITVWNLYDYVAIVENLLNIHSINSPILICHSFGLRILLLLKEKIKIKKAIITGGAGPKKDNIFLKIIKNNNKIIINNENFKNFYKKIASPDYLNLSKINKQTFKNIVNLNLKFATKFNCPILLFWGKNDKETPLWIAKLLSKHNTFKLIKTNGNHFTYLNENSKFNHEVLKFISN